MNFFTNFIDNVKRKKAEMDDRRRFLDEVEKNAKPIRRLAYMKQAIHESVNEGVAKAKADATKKLQQINAQKEPSGLMEGINNPYKFLDQHPAFQKPQQNNNQPIKSRKKKKWTHNL